MSKCFAFEFKKPANNKVMGLKLPTCKGLTASVCFDVASNIPLKVRRGELVYAHTGYAGHKVTDIVFRLDSNQVSEEMEQTVYAFLMRLHGCAQNLARHLTVRIIHEGDITYIVARVFKDKHYPCKEHPEMLLGNIPGPYVCNHCNRVLIAGIPHP